MLPDVTRYAWGIFTGDPATGVDARGVLYRSAVAVVAAFFGDVAVDDHEGLAGEIAEVIVNFWFNIFDPRDRGDPSNPTTAEGLRGQCHHAHARGRS